MSRRSSPRALEEPDTSPETAVGVLLDKLCMKLGYCLPTEARATLQANPPKGVEAFVDAVIAAEGLDPETHDSRSRSMIVDLVRAEAGRIL